MENDGKSASEATRRTPGTPVPRAPITLCSTPRPKRNASLASAIATSRPILRKLIDELIADYANDDRGIEIREIAGGYRMATKPECHDAVRMFIKSLKPA